MNLFGMNFDVPGASNLGGLFSGIFGSGNVSPQLPTGANSAAALAPYQLGNGLSPSSPIGRSALAPPFPGATTVPGSPMPDYASYSAPPTLNSPLPSAPAMQQQPQYGGMFGLGPSEWQKIAMAGNALGSPVGAGGTSQRISGDPMGGAGSPTGIDVMRWRQLMQQYPQQSPMSITPPASPFDRFRMQSPIGYRAGAMFPGPSYT